MFEINKKNMKKTIYLMGGLGNNLFQLHLYLFLESKGHKVVLNTTFLNKNIFTKILGWHIHEKTFLRLFPNINYEHNSNPITITFFLISKIMNLGLFGYIYDRNIYDYSEINKFNYFAGYWQKPENLCLEIIRKIRNNLKISKKENNNVSIHFRGGDFEDNSRLDKEYYTKAISKFPQNTMFKVFTNDKEYFSKIVSEIDNLNLQYSESESVEDDFIGLLNSDNIICSNSTFCLWAAFLSKADRIYMPKNFYRANIFSDKIVEL